MTSPHVCVCVCVLFLVKSHPSHSKSSNSFNCHCFLRLHPQFFSAFVKPYVGPAGWAVRLAVGHADGFQWPGDIAGAFIGHLSHQSNGVPNFVWFPYVMRLHVLSFRFGLCMHTYIASIHLCIYTSLHLYIYTYIHTHTYIHTYMHTYIHAYIHRYIDT